MRTIAVSLSFVVLGWLGQPAAAEPDIFVGHGLAMHGDLKYGPDFKHFEYVNPNAPKGGEVKQAAIGTFDSFNSFIIKGNPADGLGGIYDTLTAASADEPFSRYGLIAETVTSTTGKAATSTRPRWSRRSAAARTASTASSRVAGSVTAGSRTIGARTYRSTSDGIISMPCGWTTTGTRPW
jgi:ABC-type oligopeptide transport system substrate-binding subunit